MRLVAAGGSPWGGSTSALAREYDVAYALLGFISAPRLVSSSGSAAMPRKVTTMPTRETEIEEEREEEREERRERRRERGEEREEREREKSL
jgi:hypothetical protein